MSLTVVPQSFGENFLFFGSKTVAAKERRFAVSIRVGWKE
jgi:hypothetical protein